MKKLVFVSFLLVAAAGSGALAMPQGDGCGGECASCHSLGLKEAGTLLQGMGADVKQVKPAPVRGLWEVVLAKDGKQSVAYVDYSKQFIIPGAIFNIASRKPVGSAATVPQAPKLEKVKVSAIPLSNTIVMGNPKGSKRVFLFTDPDCPFCAKQHAELNKLLAKDQDLAVYVKLNPLKIHPHAYDKARVILQGESAKLLDDNFSGKPLPPAGPQFSGAGVDETMKVAQTLGITSTPTLVLPDGKVLVGYQEAAVIEKALAAGKKGKGKKK